MQLSALLAACRSRPPFLLSFLVKLHGIRLSWPPGGCHHVPLKKNKSLPTRVRFATSAPGWTAAAHRRCTGRRPATEAHGWWGGRRTWRHRVIPPGPSREAGDRPNPAGEAGPKRESESKTTRAYKGIQFSLPLIVFADFQTS